MNRTFWTHKATLVNLHIDGGIECYHTYKSPILIFNAIGDLMLRNIGSRRKLMRTALEANILEKWEGVGKDYVMDIREDSLTLSLVDKETGELTPVNKYIYFEEEVDGELVWKYTDVVGTCPWIAVEVLWWKDWVAYYKDKNWDRHSRYTWEIIPKDAMCRNGRVYRVEQISDYEYGIVEDLWYM